MFNIAKDSTFEKVKIGDSMFLNSREYATVSQEMVDIPEYDTPLAREGFPIVQVGRYQKTYEYHTRDRYGDAIIVQYPSDFKAISVDDDKVIVKVPWIGASYKLQKEDIELTREKGEPLDTTYAMEAAEEVKQKQEEALWSTASGFGENGTLGIFAQAGATFASAADWSTDTTNIYEQVRLWIVSIDQRYRSGAKVLALADDQFQEMKKSIWNNGSINVSIPGGSWYNQVKANYPELSILSEPNASSGEGVLYPKNKNVVRRIVAVPLMPIDINETNLYLEQAAALKERLVVTTPSVVVKTSSI